MAGLRKGIIEEIPLNHSLDLRGSFPAAWPPNRALASLDQELCAPELSYSSLHLLPLGALLR